MRKDQEADFAAKVFESNGFKVERPEERPEQNLKTADLRIRHAQEEYVIECKQKFPDKQVQADVHEALARGDNPETHESWYRNASIVKHFKKASSQLEATASGPDVFRIVWMHMVGQDADLRWRQAFAAFYGCVHVRSRNTGRGYKCFYLDCHASRDFRDIDALILLEGDGLNVCLNEFSPRYSKIKNSKLCDLFDKGVIDPRSEIETKDDVIELLQAPRSRIESELEKELSDQQVDSLYIVRLSRHAGHAVVPPISGAV